MNASIDNGFGNATEALARALGQVNEPSLPLAVLRILQLLAQGLNASQVSLWRCTGDGHSLRLFSRSGMTSASPSRAPISNNAMLQDSLKNGDVSFLSASAESFENTAKQLDFLPRTRHAALLAVNVLGSPHSLLVVELTSLTDETTTAELVLRLAASRIEVACTSEPHTQRLANASASSDRLSEAHLALTDESLRDLFFFAPTAMLLSEPEQGRAIAVNRHALELFGASSARQDETRTTQFWDDHAERDRFIQSALAQGFVRGFRSQLRRFDGTRFWARISSTAIEYAGRPALITSITDITDVVAAEEILNRTQQTLTTLLEASPFPLVVTRLDNGVVRYCNRKAADMFETPLSGLLGHTAPEFYVNPDDRAHFVEKLRSNGKVDGFVAQLKTQNGQPFWAMLNAKTLELNGEPVFMVAFADVTRQKNKEEELESLAFRDVLTDAYNRRYFIEAARTELARSTRSERSPVIALLDIDHFKRVNDTFGHETGDAVLREFAGCVNRLLRRADILARYGGEEFVILFPETDAETALDIVERIRRQVAEQHFSCNGRNINVTFSAGIGEAQPGEEYLSLIRRADLSLYAAKRNGRNCVSVARS